MGNIIQVKTTQNKGLPVDHWAERCLDRIVSVGDQSHPVITAQAQAFKDDIRAVIAHYMRAREAGIN